MILLLAMFMAVGAPLGDGEVRGVVDGWLAAQNAGDFAAYDKLFAARFTGVRRSGPRTVQFDRAGWMKDRARMFKKPMTVAISGVTIRAGGSSALVSFTQTFAQGGYKDSGPKEMVIVRDAGALKIASERMLRSEITVPPVPADERFRFVVAGGLLLSDAADESWATGTIKLDVNADGLAMAVRRIDASKLPPELARWQGRRVRLVTLPGVACDARIKGFRLLARSIPHLTTRNEWQEMGAPEAARQAWDLGDKVLVADVDNQCDGAFWGQPAGPAVMAPAAAEAGDEALKARALAQLRASEAWKKVQKSYLESPTKGVSRWDALDDVHIKVHRISALRAGKPITLVSLGVSRWVGCDELAANLWALYEDRGGKLVARNTPGKVEAYALAAIDSDGDGNSELLMEPFTSNFGYENGRVSLVGELWDTIEEDRIPFYDCPC